MPTKLAKTTSRPNGTTPTSTSALPLSPYYGCPANVLAPDLTKAESDRVIPEYESFQAVFRNFGLRQPRTKKANAPMQFPWVNQIRPTSYVGRACYPIWVDGQAMTVVNEYVGVARSPVHVYRLAKHRAETGVHYFAKFVTHVRENGFYPTTAEGPARIYKGFDQADARPATKAEIAALEASFLAKLAKEREQAEEEAMLAEMGAIADDAIARGEVTQGVDLDDPDSYNWGDE